MDSGPSANVLAAIERGFAFLVDSYGFELAQSTEIPSSAWYRAGERGVVVHYDLFRDAAVQVTIEDSGHGLVAALAEVLAFEPVDATLRRDVRDRALVEAEIARAAGLVERFLPAFLRGEDDAFRTRYREALLVMSVRVLAERECYEGDPRRARALYDALRAYWDERDRTHVESLAAGESAVASLRRGTPR